MKIYYDGQCDLCAWWCRRWSCIAECIPVNRIDKVCCEYRIGNEIRYFYGAAAVVEIESKIWWGGKILKAIYSISILGNVLEKSYAFFAKRRKCGSTKCSL